LEYGSYRGPLITAAAGVTMPENYSAVVAGHICLDMIPELSHLEEGLFNEKFHPGGLITIGSAIFCTGGPVSNTGLALHRLGIPTRLIAKVGADPFGGIVRSLVEKVDPSLSVGLMIDPDTITSYAVGINPPGMDRFFFYCPGANDVFCAADIDYNLVSAASLFHFGYPPSMRRMYSNGGAELVEVFRRAKSTGVTTSLDMASIDPAVESGRADWLAILGGALRYVDIFMPSLEEILYALRREEFDRMVQAVPGGRLLELVTTDLLTSLAGQILQMGVKIVGIKLGDRGLFVRTAGQESLNHMGRAAPKDLMGWANQELWAPCFQVQVIGTIGSGDATIAGFLAALLRELPLRQAVTSALAVGACNVEAADALSGIRTWDETMARIQSGWARHPLRLDAPGWSFDEEHHLWAKLAGQPDPPSFETHTKVR
jgi:sugar/nucleoside kinase (ribokinase family)